MEPPPKRACLDLETSSSSSSVSSPREPLEPTAPHFVHFKISFDPAWDYEAICKDFFTDAEPYLAILEDVTKNPHVHFQGTTLLADRTVKNKISSLVKHHFKRKFSPGCRPSSMSCRPVDMTGFQYMCKRVLPQLILAVNKFTMEDIEKMKEASTLHVKRMKDSIQDLIAAWDEKTIKSLSDEPNIALSNAGMILYRLKKKGEVDIPDYSKHYNRQAFIRGLLANPHTPERLAGRLIVL